MFYSDKLVEQAVGMPSVAQIFKVHSEAFFRDNEVMVTEFFWYRHPQVLSLIYSVCHFLFLNAQSWKLWLMIYLSLCFMPCRVAS
jgi:shikimate kinase